MNIAQSALRLIDMRSIITPDPEIEDMALELFLVSRNLERVADLATNIAEDVVCLPEGKSISHHLEDRPVSADARGVSSVA